MAEVARELCSRAVHCAACRGQQKEPTSLAEEARELCSRAVAPDLLLHQSNVAAVAAAWQFVGAESAFVSAVPSVSENCLVWPAGRSNLLRNGWVLSE